MVTIKNKEYGSNISLAAICNSLGKEHQERNDFIIGKLLEEFVTVGANAYVVRNTQNSL